MSVIIEAPYVKELEQMNGITLKGDNNNQSFGNYQWIVDTTKCVVSEYEYKEEEECEYEDSEFCNGDCYRCSENHNIWVYRIEVSSIIGKSKLVFEQYCSDKIGHVYGNIYFIGVETIGD